MGLLLELTPRAALLAALSFVASTLAAILIAAPANRSANGQLGAAIFVLVGVTTSYTIGLSRLDLEALWLRYLPVSVPLAFGPLLYGYIRRLTIGTGLPKPFPHFVPALAQLAYVVGFYLLPRNGQAVLDDGRGKDVLRAALDTAVLVSFAAYSFAGLRALARYRTWLGKSRSDPEVWALGWIRNLLVVVLITLAAFTIVRAQTWLFGRPDVFELFPFNLWIAAVAVYLGVEGRRFADRPFPHIDDISEPNEPSSNLSETPGSAPAKNWPQLGARWRESTQQSGWWREPGLSLSELARRLGTNTSQLSRAINQGLGQSFPDMINAMRASEVARRLESGDPPERDLLELAFEAGFNSKASFNRAFKAVYGIAPSEYRARATDQIIYN